jgi:hypothetical protein
LTDTWDFHSAQTHSEVQDETSAKAGARATEVSKAHETEATVNLFMTISLVKMLKRFGLFASI